MLSLHTLAIGDELEIWIPEIEQYLEVRISKKGVLQIFCTPEAAVFRRRASVFQRRGDALGRWDGRWENYNSSRDPPDPE
jgi:hypothetical protein